MTPPGGLLLRVAEWWLWPMRTTSRIVPAIADEQYLWHIACSRGQSLSALARRLALPWLVLRLCIACEIQDRLRALASVQWWLALPTLGWAMIGGALSHNVGAALWIAFGCAGFFVHATSYEEAGRPAAFAKPGSRKPANVREELQGRNAAGTTARVGGLANAQTRAPVVPGARAAPLVMVGVSRVALVARPEAAGAQGMPVPVVLEAAQVLVVTTGVLAQAASVRMGSTHFLFPATRVGRHARCPSTRA